MYRGMDFFLCALSGFYCSVFKSTHSFLRALRFASEFCFGYCIFSVLTSLFRSFCLLLCC